MCEISKLEYIIESGIPKGYLLHSDNKSLDKSQLGDTSDITYLFGAGPLRLNASGLYLCRILYSTSCTEIVDRKYIWQKFRGKLKNINFFTRLKTYLTYYYHELLAKIGFNCF